MRGRISSSVSVMCSFSLWMLAFTGPISITSGQMSMMKRASEVPPVVASSADTPAALLAVVEHRLTKLPTLALARRPTEPTVGISPEIERKIERVLILADQPSLKRPFAAATVQDALPRACEVDAALCAEVSRYLASLTRTAGITYASLTASESSGADTAVPTSHGMSSESNYNAAIAAYWQPSAAFLVTAGVLAYEGEATPTGTVASFGLDVLQVDVGYRDRWWSPAQGSAMLLSTQAATMPSVTISNYRTLTKANLRYEAFVARMSESSNIATTTGTTSGHPQLAGVHLSIEPFPGWSLGVARLMQYGGGDREETFSDMLQAFFNPSDADNTGTPEDFGALISGEAKRWEPVIRKVGLKVD